MSKWGPQDCLTGLPGSEECAVYASQELASRGHQVTLYMNPHDEDIAESSNPKWLHVDSWNDKSNRETYDLVLLWRRYDPETGRKRGKVVFFWPHDSPPPIPKGIPFPRFDGICILSDFHRKQFSAWPNFDNIPYTICGNGIVPQQFDDPMKFTNPYSIGYFSNYARGLIILMMIWPKIREEFPQATLDVYYGRETWGTMSDEQMKFVLDKFEEYAGIGVTERGKVGHLQLAEAMKNTSVLAYPCLCYGETFCITAVKCQAAGCIPVTTRVAALDETVHKDAPSCRIVNGQFNIALYTATLLHTLRRIRDEDPEKIKAERQKYIDFGHSFSWSACVDKWLALYEQVQTPKR